MSSSDDEDEASESEYDDDEGSSGSSDEEGSGSSDESGSSDDDDGADSDEKFEDDEEEADQDMADGEALGIDLSRFMKNTAFTFYKQQIKERIDELVKVIEDQEMRL